MKDLSFIEPAWDCFRDWLEYKKQRHDSYTTQSGLERAYKLLKEMCNNNPEFGAQVIDYCISREWLAIYLPKDMMSPLSPECKKFVDKVMYYVDSPCRPSSYSCKDFAETIDDDFERRAIISLGGISNLWEKSHRDFKPVSMATISKEVADKFNILTKGIML